jgi:hypothetical protein
VGQSTITTLGTVSTGTWNATVISSSKGGAGAVNGILKADGSGNVSAAAAGTDYLSPSGSGSSLTGVYLLASGGTLSGANTIVATSTNSLTISASSLSTTATKIFRLRNPTAAGSGAAQTSPMMVWSTSGYKTNATAGPQDVEFGAYALSVQGAANPTGLLKFSSNINAAGNTDLLYLDSRGYLGIGVAPSLGYTHIKGVSGIDVFYAQGPTSSGVVLEDGGFVFRPISSGSTASGSNSRPWVITYSQRVIVDNSGAGATTGTTFQSNPLAYTNSTASTERIDNYFNGARTVNFNTGAMTLQRFNVFGAPTITANGASAFTRNVNVSIGGPPITSTNVTTTTAIGLEVESSSVGAGTTTAYGAFFNAPSGATTNWALGISGNTNILDSYNIALGTSTGTKIGTSASQKIGLWNATPIVQPTTAIAAATFVANTSLISNDSATWDGYTIGQVVKALRNVGFLA